jgi:hypothetical protein
MRQLSVSTGRKNVTISKSLGNEDVNPMSDPKCPYQHGRDSEPRFNEA